MPAHPPFAPRTPVTELHPDANLEMLMRARPGDFADENLIADLRMVDALWNPAPHPYKDDPQGWCRRVAKIETWSKQDEIYQSVSDHRYTAVKSCHGPGKSYTAAHVLAWWLDTQPDPFALTSAPTSHQVRTILWREIRRAQNSISPLPLALQGKITQGQVPEWKNLQGELLAFGRKPADYLDEQEAAAAFQGIHALSLLVILDEGAGIPDWLAYACENLITNEQSRLLIIGNPDNPVGYFANAFKPGSDFNQITIKASDTPNFTEEGDSLSDELKAKLTSRIWVEERKKRWGEQSPMYQSKVEAEFPTVTDDTVFTPAMMMQAVANDRRPRGAKGLLHLSGQGRLGMDVARLGADETVIYHNLDGYCRLAARWSKLDTMESVGKFRRFMKDDNPANMIPTIVDVNGVGGGVYDRLRELGFPVVPFNGGEKAYNPLKYKNRRAEAFWEAREMFEAGLIDLEAEDEDLQAELLDIHYKVDSTGRLQIESKDDIIERIGHSPDRADAFVQSLQRAATMQELDDTNKGNQTRQQRRHNEPQHFKISNFQDVGPKDDEPDDLVGDIMDTEF